MTTFIYCADDELATARLGEALSATLPDGTVIALCGTLGSGKTRLTQALATAEGVDPGVVVSPTFVLIAEHQGTRRPVYHFDVYRLRDEDELDQIGADEYFDSDGLVLVEWAEKIADRLPEERVQIEIEVTGATSRTFTISGTGSRLGSAVQACRGILENA